MAKKFGTIVTLSESGTWEAQVVRRKTSRGTTVERQGTGFPDQQTAKQWAATSLASYLTQRDTRREAKRVNRANSNRRRAERNVTIKAFTFMDLAKKMDAEHDCMIEFKERAELLWQEVAWRFLKDGLSEAQAILEANTIVGRNYTARLQKALTGELDQLTEKNTAASIARAQHLLILAMGNTIPKKPVH